MLRAAVRAFRRLIRRPKRKGFNGYALMRCCRVGAWITMLWKTWASQGDARSTGDRAEERFFFFFFNLSERLK